MDRSQVCGWHVPARFEKELEEAARSQHMSLDELLERIVCDWLECFRERAGGEDGVEEEERQRQLRAAVMKFAGVISGDDPHQAENASAEVRARLARKYGR